MNLDNKTKLWILDLLKACGNDPEQTAKWMARNFRNMGGIAFFRQAIKEALAG